MPVRSCWPVPLCVMARHGIEGTTAVQRVGRDESAEARDDESANDDADGEQRRLAARDRADPSDERRKIAVAD